MTQLSSEPRYLVKTKVLSHNACIIDAICINCNKRFKSMHAVTMHLKMTAGRHVVNFINHGNYNKNTGLFMIE